MREVFGCLLKEVELSCQNHCQLCCRTAARHRQAQHWRSGEVDGSPLCVPWPEKFPGGQKNLAFAHVSQELSLCLRAAGCFWGSSRYLQWYNSCASCANLIQFPIMVPCCAKPWNLLILCHAAPKCPTSLKIFTVALILARNGSHKCHLHFALSIQPGAQTLNHGISYILVRWIHSQNVFDQVSINSNNAACPSAHWP